LTLTEIETKENGNKNFDISPDHKIGVDASWNHNYEIDMNKSYLVIEDSIISNAIMYYATKD
jgi:hypothetical protein